jgi:hypothetical protein
MPLFSNFFIEIFVNFGVLKRRIVEMEQNMPITTLENCFFMFRSDDVSVFHIFLAYGPQRAHLVSHPHRQVSSL